MNMLYISRMDYAKTIGWWVRRQNLKVQMFFPDLRHGSKKKALNAAIKYRDKLVEEFGPNGDIGKSIPRRHYNCKRTCSRPTGVIGVCEFWRKKRFVGYMSYFNDPPRVQNRRWFSFSIHGQQAFQKAVIWRKKNEKRIRLALHRKGLKV